MYMYLHKCKSGINSLWKSLCVFIVIHLILFISRWTLLMFKLVYHMAFEQTVAGLYDEVATFLNIFQTAAILEVSQVIYRNFIKVMCIKQNYAFHFFFNLWFLYFSLFTICYFFTTMFPWQNEGYFRILWFNMHTDYANHKLLVRICSNIELLYPWYFFNVHVRLNII